MRRGRPRYLLDNGAPITGLGFQSRFHTRVPPETIRRRLNYFEEFDLPIAATEFEMHNTIGDEYERAAMTERVMTVHFSHKLVNGIYAWSLLAQNYAGPGHRAILEDDGALRLRGKVWMYLMKNRWWTDETLTSDDQGIASLRGFKGEYSSFCHFNRIVPRCVAESVSNYPARGHSHGQITWVGYQMGRG